MRFLALAALLVPALSGQDFRGKIQLTPLVPPLNQPWKPLPFSGVMRVIEQSARPDPCAVPLLNVIPVETDKQILVTPPATGFSMRQVTPPAPSCADRPKP